MNPVVTLTLPLDHAPTVLLALQAAARYHGKGTDSHDVLETAGDVLQAAIMDMEAQRRVLMGKTFGAVSKGSGF